MKRSQLWALQRLITYFYIHREKTKNEGNSLRSAEWENVKWLTYEVFQNKINCQGHFYKKKEKCMVLDKGRFQTLFCTQCTKFKIVPYDILRCAHRTFGVRHAAAATIGHFLSHPECELHFQTRKASMVPATPTLCLKITEIRSPI